MRIGQIHKGERIDSDVGFTRDDLSEMSMLIHDDFLLTTSASVRLYHEYAVNQPIIDYHNHLSPADIARDRRFENLFEMWIAHDHYKWRLMRANGISEEFCTGNADPKTKFMAFARSVPQMLRNPIYHWTHLELKRFFGLDILLNEATAEQVWSDCNEQISTRAELSTQGILRQFKVTALCTTDDPADLLEHHILLQQQAQSGFAMYPTFRPDWSMMVHDPKPFCEWIRNLGSLTGNAISKLEDLLGAIRQRHDDFHRIGGRLSDHGLECLSARELCSEATADRIFRKSLEGHAATREEHEDFCLFMMVYFARLDTEKGWTKQLHIGVWRNNRTRLFQSAGRDAGGDSIADTSIGLGLGRYLDRLDRENCLPKMVVYNLNPRDNYLISTMLGNFQDGSIPGKLQFGAGWWYLDQREGMEWQINTLSNTGLLSRFIGMLTDSRSFMSLTRHEYFRRILCEMLGREMNSGELPDDFDLVGKMVSDICYNNAKDYLGFA